MKAIFDVCAPAKLNLFLHVTGRRANGYHELQSVFMLIDWCDQLHFEIRSDGGLSREDLLVELPGEDLILKAARALQKATRTTLGANITVEKRIPTQAGMGGGSSDAASTLLALNRLWGTNLSLGQLLEIGMGLGADVPFFLKGRNAWVEGIGEKITPIDLPEAKFLVLKPPQGLDTGRIFSAPGLKRDTKTAIISGFAEDPYGFGQNDLQAVAQELCGGVSAGIEWLESNGMVGKMTGSGSAVFSKWRGLNSGDAHANGGAQDMNNLSLNSLSLDSLRSSAPPGFAVKACRNLQTHPLLGWAKPGQAV